MALVHNALTRANELLRGYRRALGFLLPEGGVERMGETIQPSMDIWALPEWNALRGDRLLWGYQTVNAGGAGTRACVQLYHDDPLSICIVERVQSISGAILRFQFGATVLANLSTQFGARDTRQTGWSGTRLYYATPAAAPGSVRGRIENVADAWDAPLVIHTIPGVATALIVEPGVDNTAINVAIAYRVHPLFPGENVLS